MDTQLPPTEEAPIRPSDIELVARTRAGDNEAFGELWERHRQAALRAATSLTSDHDPEDLVQEAFLRILTAIRSNAGPREVFRAYLYTVLRSISMSWKSPHGATTDLDILDYVSDPEDSFENQIIDKSITGRAFASLRPEWRTVLWYSEVEGMTPRDIAPLLGMTANTIAALTYRAREGLRVSWLQAHLNDAQADKNCQWTVERLGKYNRNSLSQRNRDRVQEHLTTCIKCSILVEELDQVGRNLGLVLLPLFLGPATAGLKGAIALGTPLGSTAPAWAAASRPLNGHRVRLSVLTAAVAVGVIVAAAVAMTPAAKDSAAEPGITINAAASQTSTPAQSSPAPRTTIAGHDRPITGTPASVPQPIPRATPAPLVQLPVSQPEATSPTVVHQPSALLVPAPSPTPKRTAAPTKSPSPTPPTTPSPTASPSPTPTPTPAPTIPTVALAKPAIVSTVDRGLFLPLLRGTGVPGTLVHLLANSKEVSTATVDAAGAWSVTPEAVPGPNGTVQFAAYETSNALTSAPTPPTSPVQLQTPTVISLTTANGVRQVEFDGPAGSTVEAIIDGKPTGNYHPMNGQPLTRDLPPLASGPHTLGLRFVDTAQGLHGATITTAILVP
ncbi:sigma-70 family RNA polymerase sigma factor [Arthrobacter sp. ERGS1:01]|uniref:sigma-70 family RNA polymerase sigma factor n=1 Tax=Arthrobacter sp. ERGS1:01 TaxID=1704044 RepID=UPI0009ECA6C1|nr:sigma-70 family RNA polymerase sigma factor [Arthrobacter sp. ERGS1:01]